MMQSFEIYTPDLSFLSRKMGLWKERSRHFCELYLILFLDSILTLREKKLELILVVTNMASLGPKGIRVDQVLDPQFLVSFTVSSFSIDRFSFQQHFKCNTYGDKNLLRLDIINGPQTGTAYHAILVSSPATV